MLLLGWGSVVADVAGTALLGASSPSIGSTRKRGLSSLVPAAAATGRGVAGDVSAGAAARSAEGADFGAVAAEAAATTLGLFAAGVTTRLGVRGFFSGAARATAAAVAAGTGLT